ncbi:MAG TPA: hypothetical protein VGQ83_22640 [Polyangia bacterium]|jgi:hypothetical protein
MKSKTSSVRKRPAARKAPARATRDQLAREVAEWESGRRTLAGFVDAPEAVPRARESVAISVRVPVALLRLLKAFAEREHVGYQVLMKRWLDDRLRQERSRPRGGPDVTEVAARAPCYAPPPPFADRCVREKEEGTHYGSH